MTEDLKDKQEGKRKNCCLRLNEAIFEKLIGWIKSYD
jgi:hypothetical protein